MSALQLKLEDWDVMSILPKKLPMHSRNQMRRPSIDRRILNDFLQPETETSLAPLSNEVYVVGEIVLELAQQIPYHHPSQVKLARVMEGLTTSPKLIIGPCSDGQYIRGQRFKESLRDAYNGPNGEFPQE
ncbi:hypothetical protein BO78DRAFT_382968 [Aspergillus sclerotiicarbonarius CBS 121057]|uniref:Uncharacterized protein n=1 Tax=Aspergillus sclerotiicarbonarius (strain CBS 121057 / IBT 28362) TaxID=1448318 RepID=A0A319EP25_ASPSB|nr:hypothetical protein BO78DRAFT_382968 [Aspergillus sclerotiicarbonarius CBS 121057]